MGDLSLRELAAGIGTSHRMLIYHFGSKEGLLVAIVHEVEAQQRRFFASFSSNLNVSPAEAGLAFWRQVTDPSLDQNVRLFFELYGQAIQGRPGAVGFLDGIVDSWVEPLTEYGVQRGAPRATARADARLGVAVTRGLDGRGAAAHRPTWHCKAARPRSKGRPAAVLHVGSRQSPARHCALPWWRNPGGAGAVFRTLRRVLLVHRRCV